MNYDIKCSECPLMADTLPAVSYGCLSQRCQWLSPITQTKLTKVHFTNRELFLASVAACDKTPVLPPNLIMQWIEAV